MRALLLLLSGAGCGSAPDARAYDNEGANTLGHLFDSHPGLQLPALFSLGLWKILTTDVFDARSQHTRASYGRMRPRSRGTDSTTGHWEIAGIVAEEPFASFTVFPEQLVQAIEADAGISFLGNYRQTSQRILEELGKEHVERGLPILYSGADSTLEIAAHEAIASKGELGKICAAARRHARHWRIRQVIARPFSGQHGAFIEAAGSAAYPIAPPRSILNAIADAGLCVHGIGKVCERFGGSGITSACAAASNLEAMAAIDKLWPAMEDGLLLTTLDCAVQGATCDQTALALAQFDGWLSGFLKRIESDDLVIITAEHGNDPAFSKAGSTREEVPLMIIHEKLCIPLGCRRTFADVAASLGDFFFLNEKWSVGDSFLRGTSQERRHVSQ